MPELAERFERADPYLTTLERARGFMQKSAGNMKALLLDPLANLARLEDFPMIERPQVCRRCNFRKLCFPRAAQAPAVPAVTESPATP